MKYRSVAIAGLAKNAGKTVTLNHLIREAHKKDYEIGVTSIGVDGESIDRVTHTAKPEIRLYSGMLFATSETHYRQRMIESEVIGISPRQTSIGRVVTARALSHGKTLLSGPSDSSSLKRLINDMHRQGIRTVLVDGALSRVSLASPAVTDAVILATGAALSPDIRTIVSKTRFVCSLVDLPEADDVLREKFKDITSGVWAMDKEGNPVDLGIKTSLDLKAIREGVLRYGPKVYVAGAVTDKFLRFLTSQKEIGETELFVRDFTKIFVEPSSLQVFLKRGGRIKVLKRCRLLAVTINPWSPAGFSVDREKLQKVLQKEINVPVIYIETDEETKN